MSLVKTFQEFGLLAYLFLLLGLLLLVHIFLLIFTRFTRQITVETNLAYGTGNGRYGSVHNMISTADGKIYKVKNVLLLLHFRAAEVQAKLKPKQTYTVKGYGVRIPFLGMFPVITEVL